MFRIVHLLSAVALALVLVACEDDPPTTSHGDVPLEFPNGVGSSWTYDYADSIAVAADSVVVSIVGLKSLPRYGLAKIWQREFVNAGFVDSQYVVESGDTIKIYGTAPFPNLITVLLPLEVGNSWTSSPGMIDTTTITDAGQVRIFEPITRTRYRLRRQWSDLESSEDSEIWLVPDVGIFFMHLNATAPMSGQAVNETWKLVDYHIQE